MTEWASSQGTMALTKRLSSEEPVISSEETLGPESQVPTAHGPLIAHLPDSLLQLLQADLFGLSQQRPLVHLEHGHTVLTELHHYHIRLHLPDSL